MTEITPRPTGVTMQPIQSEAWVRANLSRGLVRNLIVEAAKYADIRRGWAEHDYGKSGHNLRAFQRVVERLRKRKFSVLADAFRVKGVGGLNVMMRVPETVSANLHMRRSETRTEVIGYEFMASRVSRKASDTAHCKLFYRKHALCRWVERGGGFDPRVDLLARLDREARAMVPVFWLSSRLPHLVALPCLHGGLWLCEIGRDDDYHLLIFADTYVGPRELHTEQVAYIEVVQKDGLLAANGIKE